MLATEHLWWLLGVHPYWRPIVNAHANVCSVLSPYCSTTYQTLSLESTRSFLCLTNVSLKYRYICFRCSTLLYTFAVFQVEWVWHLLSTACTVKPRKLLPSLLFHCQWNHHDCMASVPMHCPINLILVQPLILLWLFH